MNQKNIFTTLFIIIVFASFYFLYNKYYNTEIKSIDAQGKIYVTSCGEYKNGEVLVDNKTLSVHIADNDCKRVLGLSNSLPLGDNDGMFFVFENMGNYPFWMKDMNFPIDIVWINDNFNIVGIEGDVLPSTYPSVYGGEYFAKYVLEIPGLYCEKNNIKVGDKIIFLKK